MRRRPPAQEGKERRLTSPSAPASAATAGSSRRTWPPAHSPRQSGRQQGPEPARAPERAERGGKRRNERKGIRTRYFSETIHSRRGRETKTNLSRSLHISSAVPCPPILLAVETSTHRSYSPSTPSTSSSSSSSIASSATETSSPVPAITTVRRSSTRQSHVVLGVPATGLRGRETAREN